MYGGTHLNDHENEEDLQQLLSHTCGGEHHKNLVRNYGSLEDPSTNGFSRYYEELQGDSDEYDEGAKENLNDSASLENSVPHIKSEYTMIEEDPSYSKSFSTEATETVTDSAETVINTSAPSPKVTKILEALKLIPIASQLIVYSLLPFLIWLVVFLIAGKDDLPGGTLFVLVLMECGGRVLGYLCSQVHLPPMVGMLGLGIAIGNVPVGLMKNWNASVSAPIRQIALAVILTRAGFGLELNTLIKFKWLVLRLAVIPTVLEALSISIVTHLLLGFPWIWGILVGFVVAAVSPAVIVPRILELKAKGYGEQKGVPTVILAAASLDNVVAISFFGVALGLIFTVDSGVVAMIFQCPIEVLGGCGFGLVWGISTAFIFNPAAPSDSKDIDADESLVKGVFVLSGGIVSIFGFKMINYSGAGALGCIFSAFVTSSIWKRRGFSEREINQIKWGFTFLWKFFEPLLFGVIGSQIILNELEGKTVGFSIAALLIGALIRFAFTFATVSGAGLNLKEKLFIAIAWIPKATVQAAIGPMALDYARNIETNDRTVLQSYATDVLTIAVVVILLTAPIGEFAVMLTGPRFLSKAGDKENNLGVSDDFSVKQKESSSYPAKNV